MEGDRRPNRSGLEDLRHFLADLPELRARAGADQVRVQGGAHLSAAFALGAALPTTLMGRVEAVDTEGQLWSLTGNAQPGAGSLIKEVSRTGSAAHGKPVAVFLDGAVVDEDVEPAKAGDGVGHEARRQGEVG